MRYHPRILSIYPYGPMFYDEDTVTTSLSRQIAAEIIREKHYTPGWRSLMELQWLLTVWKNLSGKRPSVSQ